MLCAPEVNFISFLLLKDVTHISTISNIFSSKATGPVMTEFHREPYGVSGKIVESVLIT